MEIREDSGNETDEREQERRFSLSNFDLFSIPRRVAFQLLLRLEASVALDIASARENNANDKLESQEKGIDPL